MTELRHCKSCKFVKDTSHFYESNPSKCKDCVKKAVAKYRKENIESVREYDRNRALLPHRIAKNVEITREWRKNNPKRWKAHILLNNALRAGIVQKLPCLICGEKSEAHHPDYDQPLDVVWLCPAHHKQTHAMVRKAA